MAGKGRFGVLAVRSPDPVLSLVAPIGLAVSAGSALVVDLAGGVRTPARRTLADVVEEGPRLDELGPGRPGVAILPAGPVNVEQAIVVIEELSSRWPALVVRVSADEWPGPTVPVQPLYPGWLAPSGPEAAVWQPLGGGSRPPGPGPVLPRLRGATVRRLLAGRMPGRSRWTRAWEQVWGLPWA